MVTLIRVEAAAETLEQVAADLDRVEAAFRKVDKSDLPVHDEHYERVSVEKFKGRRVLRVGDSPGGVTLVAGGPNSTAGSSPHYTVQMSAAA